MHINSIDDFFEPATENEQKAFNDRVRQEILHRSVSKQADRERNNEVADVSKCESKNSHVRRIEDIRIRGVEHIAHEESYHLYCLLNASYYINEGISAIVDDSFTKCFVSIAPDPWNWNVYLLPLWAVGVIIRYFVLFPARFLVLCIGWALFGLFFGANVVLMKRVNEELSMSINRHLISLLCGVFVASWTGVIKYHGPRPVKRAGSIYVANHTSMIDLVLLQQNTAFASIGQRHSGWVGFIQSQILDCLGCIWFDRGESKDRTFVQSSLKRHLSTPNSNPLLIFPEGTCVNNEYCVMFKKGVFELGAPIYPIAIKYNKVFVDAFWNSRSESFTYHLLKLMSSWAVVCDVYYLAPQTIMLDESPSDFAERVKRMICSKIGLKSVQWDGYLKHYQPSKKMIDLRQNIHSKSIVEKACAKAVQESPDLK